MLKLTLEFKDQATLAAWLGANELPVVTGKTTKKTTKKTSKKAAPTPAAEFAPPVQQPVVQPPVIEQPVQHVAPTPVVEQPVAQPVAHPQYNRDAVIGEITAIVTPLVQDNPEASTHAAQIIGLVQKHAQAGGYVANKASELQDAQLPAFLSELQGYDLQLKGAQPAAQTAIV